jgi:hypothetical protein
MERHGKLSNETKEGEKKKINFFKPGNGIAKLLILVILCSAFVSDSRAQCYKNLMCIFN